MSNSLLACFIALSLTLMDKAHAQPDSTFTRLLFVGDIMQHGSQIRGAYHAPSGGYSYETCLKEASRLFQRCDLVFGNLELTLAGKPYQGYPRFSAPSQLVRDLQNSGLDVAATANNHTGDHGYAGITRTCKKLDSLNMPYIGTFATAKESRLFQPFMVNENGIRLAIFNYALATNMPLSKESGALVSLLDSTKIKRQLAESSVLRPDLTIAYVHWGTEYQQKPDSLQRAWGKFLHYNGIDIIIGSHPHTLQPIVWDEESGHVTAYSLGNFLSGQRERYQDGGLCLEIELCKLKKTDSTFVSRVIAHPSWVYKSATVPAKYSVLFPFSNNASLLKRMKGQSMPMDRFIADTKNLLATSIGVELKLDTVLSGNEKLKTAYYQIGFALPRTTEEINSLLEEHPEFAKLLNQNNTPFLGPFESRAQAAYVARSIWEKSPDLYIEYVTKSITHFEMQAQDYPSLPSNPER